MAANKSEIVPVHEWETLLREFHSLPAHVDTESDLVPELEQLLGDFDLHKDRWQEEQKFRADDFNILGIMRWKRRELCHSDILAWLLDSSGSHAQGKMGFDLFLERTNLPEEYAKKKYHVIREFSGGESQIDIVIEAPGEFIIGIENKIDAEESDTQTEREWRDLQQRKRTISAKGKVTAFFLTPSGRAPLSKYFRPISWQVIADIFETFADKANAEMIKMFAKHYAETIRHEILPAIEEEL